MDARVASIQIGQVMNLGQADAPDPHDRPWTTGIFKQQIVDDIELRLEGLAGDAQADLKNHGGPDKAVNVYPGEHYARWRQELARADMLPGAFGENFTTTGLSEDEVCIGDRFGIGARAVVQVSQPRQPCGKLIRRWRISELPQLVVRTGRTGWYLRVLTPGMISAGCALRLLDRPYPAFTIAIANRLMYRTDDRDGALALAACPALSRNWQDTLGRR